MDFFELESMRNNRFFSWLGHNPVMPDIEFYSLEVEWKDHTNVDEVHNILKPHYCGHMYSLNETTIIKSRKINCGV